MADMQFSLEIQGLERHWRFPLPGGETLIGRVPGSDLQLENAQVSRQHARITISATEVRIEDLNSSNGTYRNEQKLTPNVPETLTPGDVLKIGPFQLVLVLEVVETPPAPEPEAPAPPPAPEPEPEPVQIEVPLQPAATVPVEQAGLAPSNGSAPARLDGFEPVPTGLTNRSQRLIHYLPGIYQTDFMERFLGIFESILIPIEWNVDNFDMFLDPGTAPAGFLPWLSGWFGILLQPGWSESQRRAFLQRAHFLFARRGTRSALAELLQIFTGQPVEIDDTSPSLPAATFRVRLPLRQEQVDIVQLSALIDAHKPAHTTYFLEFAR